MVIVLMMRSGERPFGCPYCSQTAIQRSDINKHMKRRHPEHYQAPLSSKHEKTDTKPASRYMCVKCGLNMHTQEKLTLHVIADACSTESTGNGVVVAGPGDIG